MGCRYWVELSGFRLWVIKPMDRGSQLVGLGWFWAKLELVSGSRFRIMFGLGIVLGLICI